MSDLENLFGGSSDEDEDVFTYEKKDFHKREKNEENNEDSPPAAKRGRRAHKKTSTDDALSKLEHRQERRKASSKLIINLDDDDDDDDSDVEITAQAAAAPAKKQATIDIDSSDDEAPKTYYHQYTPAAVMQHSGIAKETCDMIAQARNARYKLQMAQRYHAEDCYIPAAPPVAPVVNIDSPPSSQQAAPQKPQDYGPSISLKLRTNQVINGKRSESSTMESMSIRHKEPFSKLLERYQTKHKIVAAESSVKFSLDGERIDLLKTPTSYDLENDDIIEVLVTTLVVRNDSQNGSTQSSSAAAPSAHYGPPLQLKLRTLQANGTLVNDVMTIRLNEPLQHLLERYKAKKNLSSSANVKFTFDGETMHMNRTPASYDMETDEIIEVVCK